MSFLGSYFTFDNVNSKDFNLIIASINTNLNDIPSGSTLETQTVSAIKSSEKLLLGIKQTSVLEFPLEIVSKKALDLPTMLRIKEWLYGKSDFKKLQIQNEWYEDFYFNCVLHAKEDIKFGGEYFGLRCDVECNSPYAYTFPMTRKYNFDNSIINPFMFDNFSAHIEGLRPIIKFTLSNSGNSIKILNKTTDRELSMVSLKPNETIIIDNKNQIITSSESINRFSNLKKGKNQGFLNLAHGINQLECQGLVSNFEITYQFAIRLGGG